MRGDERLVVLEGIEHTRDRLIGLGRERDGSAVSFPIDEAMLLGIARMVALREGAAIWVSASSLAPRRASPALGGPGSDIAALADLDVGAFPREPAADAARQVRVGRRLVLAHGDPLVRSLVGQALAALGHDVRTSTGRDEARAIVGDERSVVLVTDLTLPDGSSGIGLASDLAAADPSLGIVYLTRLPDARFVDMEIASGRRVAYLRMGEGTDLVRLEEAIAAVAERRSNSTLRDDLRADRPLGHLTRRQLWLLGRLADGHLLAEIAATRGMSERGTQRLLTRTYARLGITPRSTRHARSVAVRAYCDAAGMATVRVPEVLGGAPESVALGA